MWGCFDCQNVEKVHMYACKRIPSISSQSPNHTVYGELGRHHMSVLTSKIEPPPPPPPKKKKKAQTKSKTNKQANKQKTKPSLASFKL